MNGWVRDLELHDIVPTIVCAGLAHNLNVKVCDVR